MSGLQSITSPRRVRSLMRSDPPHPIRSFKRIDYPQPIRSLKRPASQVTDLETQSSRLQPFRDEKSPSPTTARLAHWILTEPICFDRKRSRSDSFLLELERGNNEIEAASRLSLERPPQYPESEKRATTRTDPMAETATNEQPCRKMVLELHGILIDGFPLALPSEVEELLNGTIRQHNNSATLSASEYRDFYQSASAAEVAPEQEGESEFLSSAMFPQAKDCPEGITKSAGSSWNGEPLPKLKSVKDSITMPRPDRFYGFEYNRTSTSAGKRLLLDQNSPLHRWAKPAKRSDIFFPFLTLELKAPCQGGTSWGSENQGAGSGAHSVSGLRKLYEFAGEYGDFTPTISNTLVFVVTCNPSTTYLWVHYYNDKEGCYNMKRIEHYATFDRNEVNRFRAHWTNILKWARDTRWKEICKMLEKLAKAWDK